MKVKSYKDNKEYAMKYFESTKMKNKKLAKQIIYETFLLYSLNHENIMKVTDFY